MKRLIILMFLLAWIFLPGCSSDVKPQISALELQALQSRCFESDKRAAFAAVMSAFQDTGYFIESANYDTGFISAKSPTKDCRDFWGSFMTFTKAGAFVEELRPGYVKIRLNLVNSVERYSAQGSKTVNEIPSDASDAYRKVFDKIQESIASKKGSLPSSEPKSAQKTDAVPPAKAAENTTKDENGSSVASEILRNSIISVNYKN